MHRVTVSALALVIGLMGSSGCTRSVPRDHVVAAIGAETEEVLVWAVSARECVSCQMDAHALRRILGDLKEALVVQRGEGDAPVVDGFLRRERISAEPTNARILRVGANGGAWAVVTGGQVVFREDYSLKVKGDGIRALREIVQRAALVETGARGATTDVGVSRALGSDGLKKGVAGRENRLMQ